MRAFLGVLFFLSSFLHAQNISQFALKLDNDSFYPLHFDRYYTNGVMLSYSRQMDSFLFFKKKENTQLQGDFFFGHQIFTPSHYETNISYFDRPFAGWLYTGLTIRKVHGLNVQNVGLEVGVTGKYSIAEKLQKKYHRLFGVTELSWEDQIPSEVLINTRVSYARWFPVTAIFGLNWTSQISLGNKDVYLQQTLGLRLGKMNSIKNSVLYGFMGNGSKECFVVVDVAYRYVVHNTLIEGSIWNKVPFSLPAEKNVILTRIGFVYSTKKNTFKFLYCSNTRETHKAYPHDYLSLFVAFKLW